MATEKKSEVGIIGQIYEDRKSKRVGVLESREEKYKTLMMRDSEGKTFNITYSTFRSNWRKYQGEEVIQTSTQVEEVKVEEKKKAEKNKKIVETKSEVVKMTTEEKVKSLKALAETVEDKIKTLGLDLKVDRTSKGGIVVRSKKLKLFELWIKFGLDKYDFVSKDDIVQLNKKLYDSLAKTSEYTYKEKWDLKHFYKVPVESLDEALNIHIELAKLYVESKNKKEEEN